MNWRTTESSVLVAAVQYCLAEGYVLSTAVNPVKTQSEFYRQGSLFLFHFSFLLPYLVCIFFLNMHTDILRILSC